jgi:hypothetical protein
VTSSTTRLSNVGVTETTIKLTGRILIYELLKLIAIRPWEVVAVNVLLELRIGPGVGRQDELFCGRRSAHVMLALAKLNRVPSSSQFPRVARLATTVNNESRQPLLPVTNGILATLPCNTSCCGGALRNAPSALGPQTGF